MNVSKVINEVVELSGHLARSRVTRRGDIHVTIGAAESARRAIATRRWQTTKRQATSGPGNLGRPRRWRRRLLRAQAGAYTRTLGVQPENIGVFVVVIIFVVVVVMITVSIQVAEISTYCNARHNELHFDYVA